MFDRGWPVDVGGHEQRFIAPVTQADRKLGCSRRLAGSLETDEQDDGRLMRRSPQGHRFAAQQPHELIIDDRNNLLDWRDTFEHRFPGGSLTDGRYELLDDLEIDVRLEQRQADFPQCLVQIGFADRPAAAQLLKDALELVGERLKHRA